MSTRRRRRNYYASSGGGGGTVTRTDNFNRADSSTGLGTPSDGGSAYTARSGTILGISGNVVYMVAGGQLDSGGTFVGAISTLTCSPNGTFKIDVQRDGSNNGSGGIAFRWIDANNFFVALQNGNTIYVHKLVAGTANLVYSGVSHNYPFTGFSNVLQVVLTSAGYTVQTIDSVNGTQTEYGPIADTTGNSSSEHGPYAGDASIRLDNLSFIGT